MRESPERAQARFLEEIAPELHRKADFAVCAERPGRLGLSDGVIAPLRVANRGAGDYEGLRIILARRIRVDFEGEGIGTRVTVRGHVQREVRRALEQLGQPGYWPDLGALPVRPFSA
jgi:hypothetical protein